MAWEAVVGAMVTVEAAVVEEVAVRPIATPMEAQVEVEEEGAVEVAEAAEEHRQVGHLLYTSGIRAYT